MLEIPISQRMGMPKLALTKERGPKEWIVWLETNYMCESSESIAWLESIKLKLN